MRNSEGEASSTSEENGSFKGSRCFAGSFFQSLIVLFAQKTIAGGAAPNDMAVAYLPRLAGLLKRDAMSAPVYMCISECQQSFLVDD